MDQNTGIPKLFLRWLLRAPSHVLLPRVGTYEPLGSAGWLRPDLETGLASAQVTSGATSSEQGLRLPEERAPKTPRDSCEGVSPARGRAGRRGVREPLHRAQRGTPQEHPRGFHGWVLLLRSALSACHNCGFFCSAPPAPLLPSLPPQLALSHWKGF